MFVLEPFADVTDSSQVSDYVTVSYVVPSIVSLNKKLEDFAGKVKFQLPLVEEL